MLKDKIPKPKSIMYPKMTGDNADENTMHACNKPFTVPIFLRPYNSAQRDPIKGVPIPRLKPNNDI